MRRPNGYWSDPEHVRAELEAAITGAGIMLNQAPQICRRRWFDQHGLGALLRHYRRSPFLLLTSLYPGRWKPVDFPEVPKADDLQEQMLHWAGGPVTGTVHQKRRFAYMMRRRNKHCGRPKAIPQTKNETPCTHQ